LDVGTGGGEIFLQLAPHFGTGVGIDHNPEMIRVARANTPPAVRGRVSFEPMEAEALSFPDAAFETVLNRHASVFAGEVARVLRPGGHFVSQQVGDRNTQRLFDAFGWGSNGAHWAADRARRGRPPQDRASLTEAFARAGCAVVAWGEYDVRYFFQDVASLVFFLKSAPFPEDFDPDRHWRPLAELVDAARTPRGIETNEHRTLLVARKLDAPD
jgi:SAM-dependent methyltransferase